MFIRSERLFLRPAWREDAQDLHAAIADERVVRNLARAPWPYTLDDARAFVESPQDRRHPSLLITLPGARGSRLIGGIGLSEEAAGAQLGYWIAPEAWGHGYATEATSAILRLARTLGHEQITARHFLDNPASARVLEKVGFRHTGELVELHSRGRAGSATARELVLRFETTGDCVHDTSPDDDGAMGKRAA